jgi:hypothetical protein
VAKEKEVPDPPEPDWTPDQPIPDPEGEEEAQRRHMLQRRLDHLNKEAEKKTKAPKKKGLWGKD